MNGERARLAEQTGFGRSSRMTFTVLILTLIVGLGWIGPDDSGAARLDGTGPAKSDRAVHTCKGPLLFERTSINAGGRPSGVALADLNGDGLPDIVTVDSLDDAVSIYLNSGGGFASAGTVAVGDTPESIASGDFNRDGNIDILVANRIGDSITVLHGDGSGGLKVMQTLVGVDAPDNPRGFVKTGGGVQPPNPDLARAYDAAAKQQPVRFDRRHQEILTWIAHDACNRRSWRLHFVATEPTHMHFLVSWSDDQMWQDVSKRLKNLARSPH